MVMEGGYPRDMFVEPVQEELLCALCDKVLRSAKTTPCGHIYCKGCVESWVVEHRACPRNCTELAVKNLAWAGHIDTVVSGLQTRCKNVGSGCKVQVPLREKAAHEAKCPHSKEGNPKEAPLQTENVDVDWEEETEGSKDREIESKESVGFFQRATKIVLSFRSRNARKKSSGVASSNALSKSTEGLATAGGMLTQRTFRLKRNRPKEPLGLVLLSGDKTIDGRHKSYLVKKVNRDTLGWRAGILAGDRIIKVDNQDLCKLTPQESVARIKEKSVVTLTVLRETGPNKHSRGDHFAHIYDEIYTDQGNQLSQHALSQPMPTRSYHGPDLPAVLSQFDENYPPTLPPMDFGKLSPSAQHKLQLQRNIDEKLGQRRHFRPTSPGAHVTHQTSPNYGQGERTSKDSGLSSGSSDSPNSGGKQVEGRLAVQPSSPFSSSAATAGLSPTTALDLNRDTNVRKSYRTEQEMVRKLIKEHRRKPPSSQSLVSSNQPTRNRNCRINGDYELEDIHLEKNGTSQLGITLGYDSSAAHGSCLYVCEIVAGGLAAQDGRLRTGDIIRRVNGFRVFDPEEAILLFLEQDQDITLSVARKIKVPSRLRPQPEPDLDYLESTLLRNGPAIRKTDSCGSLDSHTHHTYAILEPPSETGSREQQPVAHPPRDKRARSRELQLMATSRDSINESTTTTARMRLMATSRDSIDEFLSTSRGREEDPYRSRRGSSPSNHTPLGGGGLRPITGSSPNLLRVQHSPPALYHQMASGSNLLVGPHSRQRIVIDRPCSTSPDSKFWSPTSRPIGGVVCQRKLSSPNLLEAVGSPTGREPRIMTPLSPTHQAPPSFHGIAKEIRRLPNRFDGHLEVCAAGGVEGRRESLV